MDDGAPTRSSGRLAVAGPAGPPRSRALDGDRLLVGRALHADLRLDDPRVSGDHLELSWHGTTLLALDLDSSNGTLLNGRPLLRATRLQDRDVLALGSHRIEVLLAAGPPPAAPTARGRREELVLSDGERAVARALVAPLRDPTALAARPATRAAIAAELAVSERTVQRRIDALATRFGIPADAGPDRPRLVARRVLELGLDR